MKFKGTKIEIIERLLHLEDKLGTQYEISEYKPKRSLNQNGYAWVLVNEIANSMHISKEEVYLKCLEDYGQSELILVKTEVPLDNFFKYYSLTEDRVVGKNGIEYQYVKVYKGSSQMTTNEMAILLDGIIQEANQLDIQTLTPMEIAKMREMEKHYG